MYRLAIVTKLDQYDFGAHHDRRHIHNCVNTICPQLEIIPYITNETWFGEHTTEYDGVIFIGLSDQGKLLISGKHQFDIFVWSNNQLEWANNPSLFDNTAIIFEQSNRKIKHKNLYHVPTGFQHDWPKKPSIQTTANVIYSGTLSRQGRKINPDYRIRVLHGLIENDISVVNYNGKSQNSQEAECIKKIGKSSKFTVINQWAEPHHYSHGYFCLNMPFHHLGINIDANWDMTRDELENTIWFHSWDIFKAIGGKANIITYNCSEMRDLGLDDKNCSFYEHSPSNVDLMLSDIIKIIKSNIHKTITDEIYSRHTYICRWRFIIDKINDWIKNKNIKQHQHL